MSRDRLGVVARLRRYAERQSQQDLAEAQRRLGDAKRKLEELRRPTYDGQGTELSTAHLMALRAQGIIRAEDLEIARVDWARSEQLVRDAIHEVQNATSKRKASEELIEKRRLANAAIAARASQAALDELVIMRQSRAVRQ